MDYYSYERSPPRGGAAYGVLGVFVALGVLYVAFSLLAWGTGLEQGIVVALVAAFAGGFASRTGARGARVGFAALAIPLLGAGALLLAEPYAGVTFSTANLPPVVEALGGTLGEVLMAGLGVALVVLAFLAGVVGMVMGALGGWLSGRLRPPGSRSEDLDYLVDDDPWGRDPW